MLHERGIEISHETIRSWWNRFGPMFASGIGKKRVQQLRAYSNWRWHLDEVFVKCRYVGTRGTSPLSSQFWDEGDTHEQGSTRDHA